MVDADKLIAENGNRHQVASAWKIFKSPSTKELEDMVNGFSKDHEVEEVKFEFQQIDQTGTMLCDRVLPSERFYTLNIASIRYKRDITMELVEERLAEWLYEKIHSKYNRDGNAVAYIYDMATGTKVLVKDAMKEYSQQLVDSDEYKALKVELEARYSLPDKEDK